MRSGPEPGIVRGLCYLSADFPQRNLMKADRFKESKCWQTFMLAVVPRAGQEEGACVKSKEWNSGNPHRSKGRFTTWIAETNSRDQSNSMNWKTRNYHTYLGSKMLSLGLQLGTTMGSSHKVPLIVPQDARLSYKYVGFFFFSARVLSDPLSAWQRHSSSVSSSMKSSLNLKVILSLGDILESTECKVCITFGSGHPIHLRTTENH